MEEGGGGLVGATITNVPALGIDPVGVNTSGRYGTGLLESYWEEQTRTSSLGIHHLGSSCMVAMGWGVMLLVRTKHIPALGIDPARLDT
jgi:hypothetical protein